MSKTSNLLTQGPNLFIPFAYTFASRLSRLSEKTSWFIVYPILLAAPCYLVSGLPLSSYIIVFVIAFGAWQSIYEIGYLYNDAFTTSKESKPTLRFPEPVLNSIREKFSIIILVRVTLAAVLVYGLTVISKYYNDTLSVELFVAAICLSQIAFFLHNRFRSRVNIFSYLLLSVVKYTAIPVLVFSYSEPMLIGLFVLIFPLPRTMEHAVKVKYGLRWLKEKVVGEFEVFRVNYYLVLSSFYFVVLLASDGKLQSIICLVTTLFMLAYRGMIWVMIKLGRYKRSKFKVHDWSGKDDSVDKVAK